jgi:hypothetical protein
LAGENMLKKQETTNRKENPSYLKRRRLKMNKKTRKKIKKVLLKEYFPLLKKPLAIFRDMLENAILLAEELANNPKLDVNIFRVKIANVNKFLKYGFRWVDSKDIIENSEPFKVGDVGYINFVGTEEESLPPIIVELIAECFGVEILGEIPLKWVEGRTGDV